MIDIVNDYFKRYYPDPIDRSKFQHITMLGGMSEYVDKNKDSVFPCMACADGFEMSVQGHCGAYSTPRDDFASEYTTVEVGFPSAREELLMPYAEDAARPTDTIYGYVPIKVVVAVIERHGGLAS